MMSQPIGIKILKGYGPMTRRVAKRQSASRRQQKLIAYGEQKICEDKWLTPVSLEPSVMDGWFDSPVADAEKQRQSLITKITINRLKLCGFASPVISSGTKN